MFFHVTVSGFLFKHSFPSCILIVYKCMFSIDLIAYNLMKFTSDSSLFEEDFGFFTYIIMWPANKYSLLHLLFISIPNISFTLFFIEV